MKHLILSASLTLAGMLATAPAFAGSMHDAVGTPAQQQTAMTADAQQKHTYSYGSDQGTGGAIETRNARMNRSAMDRSPNAKAAWKGQPHYY
jgi:hypothetical protein